MADEHDSSGSWIPGLSLALRLWGRRTAARRGDNEPVGVDWRRTVRSRVLMCAAIFAFWTAAIEARLVYLQVFQRAEMTSRANRQQLREVKLAAKRGEIYDRNGWVLAFSVDVDTIWADPSQITDPANVAQQVCEALANCGAEQRDAMERQLRKKNSQFEYLTRMASFDDARRVRALKLPGVWFKKESRRYYPHLELAAHLLGYVGTDNVGLAGLESTYNARVRGRDGRMLVQTDAHREAIVTREERPPTAGDSLELTIDEMLQYIAERELRAGVKEHKAAGGSAVIMDPYTGEILALANWPTFNPNTFGRADEDARRNRAVQDHYEPGSTFKIVTASAALDEHVIVADAPIDCSPGHISFGSRVIDDVHPYGVLSFTDVIVKSSNVGAIKVGLRLGPERLVRYASRFGFGQPIAPDFRGENPGLLSSPTELNPGALASMSMGYQVAVTPIQMAAAVSSIANGGQLIEPRVVRAFVNGDRRAEVPRRVLRQTIGTETADVLTTIMEGVVERGTAKSAQISGYTIAGKTGTASRIVNGRYSKNDYMASFVGFVPSRKPAFTIVVVIDMAHVSCGSCYYGGVVAAPIFQRIAEAALRHRGIPPTLNPAPPVLVARRDSTTDVEQTPVRASAMLKPAIEPAQAGLMPDLRGLSAREAVRALSRAGIAPQLEGDGFVMEQSIDPGVPLAAGASCVLKLGRRAIATVGGSPQ